MGTKNRVNVLGYLGRDAELRYTQTGKAVASFTVATTERWTGQDGERHEETTWHKVVAWGKQAEFVGKLQKGSQVDVEGRLTNRKWQDKSGQDRYTTEINASSVLALGPKPGERVVKGEAHEEPEEDGDTPPF
jgi:single-strand DNA-binding protein